MCIRFHRKSKQPCQWCQKPWMESRIARSIIMLIFMCVLEGSKYCWSYYLKKKRKKKDSEIWICPTNFRHTPRWRILFNELSSLTKWSTTLMPWSLSRNLPMLFYVFICYFRPWFLITAIKKCDFYLPQRTTTTTSYCYWIYIVSKS